MAYSADGPDPAEYTRPVWLMWGTMDMVIPLSKSECTQVADTVCWTDDTGSNMKSGTQLIDQWLKVRCDEDNELWLVWSSLSLFCTIYWPSSRIHFSSLVMASRRLAGFLRLKQRYGCVSSAILGYRIPCLFKMSAIGRIYTKKKRGPRTNPCGTLMSTSTGSERSAAVPTVCVHPLR